LLLQRLYSGDPAVILDSSLIKNLRTVIQILTNMRNKRGVRGICFLDEWIKNGHMLKVAYLVEKGASDFKFRQVEHAKVKVERSRGVGKNCVWENIPNSFNMHR
jgi:hypothetical protein